jgi:hypothetical protein
VKATLLLENTGRMSDHSAGRERFVPYKINGKGNKRRKNRSRPDLTVWPK